MRIGKSGKIGLADLRRKLGLKGDTFKVNAATITKILEGPPVASLIGFGDGLYLQHDRLPRKGRAAARGRWYFKYYVRVGDKWKEHREFLGSTNDLTPTQARDKCHAARLKHRSGINLRDERKKQKQERQQEKKQGITLADIWAPEGKGEPPEGMSRNQWVNQLLASWGPGGANHRKPVEYYLDELVSAQLTRTRVLTYLRFWLRDISNIKLESPIAYRPIVDLQEEDIAKAVKPQWDTLDGDTLCWMIHDMIEFARSKKGILIARNPAYLPPASRVTGRRRAGGRSELLQLLGGPKEPHKKKPQPAITPWQDSARFMARLRATPPSPNWLSPTWRKFHEGHPDRRMLAAEFCILMNGRDFALTTIRYSQVYLEAKGVRVENKEEKGGPVMQPCSKRAWHIIETCAAEDGIDLTLPASQRDERVFFKTGTAATEFGARNWTHYLKQVAHGANPPFSHFGIHGFRSNCTDWATNEGYETELIDRCLMHKGVHTKTQRPYFRDPLYEQKRELLENWSQFLAGKELPPGEVIIMDRRLIDRYDDTELLKEAHDMMASENAPDSLQQALMAVAERAGGEADLIGRTQRLRKKYLRTYGYPKRKHLLEHHMPLLDEMHSLIRNGEVRSTFAATDIVVDRSKSTMVDRFSRRQQLWEQYETVYGVSETEKFKGYVSDDLLIEEMRNLRLGPDAPNKWRATLPLAERAEGDTKLVYKRMRLYRHYNKLYPDDR